MEEHSEGPLDQNLERLLKVAPARERMDDSAKARLSAALRKAQTPAAGEGIHALGVPHEDPSDRARLGNSAPSPQGQDRRPRGWKWRIAATAAAAILLFFVFQGLRSDEASSPTDSDGRVAEKTKPHAETPEPGTHRGPVDGPMDGPGNTLAQGPLRTPAGTATTGVDPDPTTAGPSQPLGALAIAGTLLLDSTVASPPPSATIWIRPLVPLPRVADAERFDFDWGDQRSLPFEIGSALAPARAMGAGRVLVHVEAPGLGSSSAIHLVPKAALDPASPREDPLGSVTLTLTAEESATGYVLDGESSAAIAGAIVIAVDQIPQDTLDVQPEKQGDLPSCHARTDASGKFHLKGLRPSATARLRASAPGYGPAWVTLAAQGDSAAATGPRFHGTLKLRPGGRVHGVIERANGTRWAGAGVIVSRQDFDPATITRPVLTYGSAIADAEGRFEVLDLPTGTYVTLLMGDLQRGVKAVPDAFELTRVKAGESTEINIMSVQASANAAVSGHLRSAAGRPMAGRSLMITLTEATSQDDSGWRATTTADDGSFAFADLSPGRYTLMHNVGGFAEMSAIWSGSIDSPMELDLTLPQGSVRLWWSTPSGGPDAPGENGGAWAMIEKFHEASGAWEYAGSGLQAQGNGVPIRHLMPGRYRGTFQPNSAGTALALTAPFDIATEAVEVRVEVPPGGPLQVLAVDQVGSPIPGLSAHVRPGPGSPWAGRRLPQQVTPVTGPDGQAELRGVPYGDVEVRLHRAGKVVATRRFRFRSGGPGSPGDKSSPARVVVTQEPAPK